MSIKDQKSKALIEKVALAFNAEPAALEQAATSALLGPQILTFFSP